MFRATKLEEDGIMTIGRYGVQARMMKNPASGRAEWQVVPSLPDFEGTLAGGRQIIIEAKTCSQASYPLYQTQEKRPKQIAHMMKRSRFGALCFLLLHFNRRELKTKTEEATTYAIPVSRESKFWAEYENGGHKNLTRDEAELYGIRIPWNCHSTRASKLTPDLTAMVQNIVF